LVDVVGGALRVRKISLSFNGVEFLIDYRVRRGRWRGSGGELPGAFDAEGFEVRGFLFVEMVFDDVVDACAAGASAEAGTEVVQIFGSAGCDDLDVAFFSVADPAAETEFARLAVDEPAEADTLYPTLHVKMENHGVVTIASVADGGARRNWSGADAALHWTESWCSF
jgi:hypothetical protein